MKENERSESDSIGYGRVWTAEEKSRMEVFLSSKTEEIERYMAEYVENNGKRNKIKFFKQMAEFIRTKTDKQCKSRYQKIEAKVLARIGLNDLLLKSYLVTKHKKRPLKARFKENVRERREEANKEVLDIENYDDLKLALNVKIMPLICSEAIKTNMTCFIQGLPDGVSRYDITAFSLNQASRDSLIDEKANFLSHNEDFHIFTDN